MMKKWEYWVWPTTKFFTNFHEFGLDLNEKGQEGWEMCGMYELNRVMNVVLKREWKQ